MIRVAVSGAAGRMGQEVVRAVSKEKGIELVGAVDVHQFGKDAGEVAGIAPLGVAIGNDLRQVLRETGAQVVVDFTSPRAVFDNARTAIEQGVHPVIGTTGMAAEERMELQELARKAGIGGLIAPNFAIGAVLMMKFAEMATNYFPSVEIIELHHDQKLDAPSGTALKTAEVIAAARGDNRPSMIEETIKLEGARGGEFARGIRVHSVRLPGLVAHQEVIFGGVGQTLTIRHDSLSRESFMPGVILAVRRVMASAELIYGLENLLFQES
ncbi:MAG: 4-hydroxy-tetrahydrodipicolinate reductase [Desulforudis sp.]|nr:4-hydroxy-tetrahydrodipicolinate reductase [Clostridia bacterium]RJX22698.1 MAG: 4-hydroxy-tetrahydrodipicolinate reductase [Desulforudis sp.]